MTNLQQHFEKYFDCPSFVYFVQDENITEISTGEGYLLEGVEKAEFKDLEYIDSFYDTNDNYIKYIILKFEGVLYQLTVFFNSYSAAFKYNEVGWEDFKEVKAVTKEIIVYE